MPTYEYACSACGEHLEVVQSFSDEALTECPACKGPLRKVFAPVGIVLKGSGFYKTDSRAPAAKAKSAEGASGEEKSSASTAKDPKPSESGSKDSKDSKDSKSASDSAKPTPTAAAG